MYYDEVTQHFYATDSYSSVVSITADANGPWTINSSGTVCRLTVFTETSTYWDCLSTDA
jgi:hypothetical protein